MKATIIGGSGYTARELIRILSAHPAGLELTVTSTRFAGKSVNQVHPSLDSSLVLQELDLGDADSSDVIFVCVPHTKSMDVVSGLSARVVDLSADFRLKDASEYERFYGVKHSCPELLDEAVYGLPEYFRDDIRKARIVANPGCYPTGAVLACKPLLDNFSVDCLVVDAKSGVSGAGRGKEEELQGFVSNQNFKAYKIVGHQHTPEINQVLGFKVCFTPHVIPADRGIFSTVHALTGADPAEVKEAFKKKYAREPFVKLAEDPDLAGVVNTNVCRIGGFAADDGRLVVTSAIDNLLKGASGQAVQNMNIMFGFEETAGLI